MWNAKKVNVSMLRKEDSWMVGEVASVDSDCKFYLFHVYGPVKKEEKKLWLSLTEEIKSIGANKVIIGGEFNAISYLSEKNRSLKKINRVIQNFMDFTRIIALRDCPPKNGQYTWTNRRAGFTSISKRLDRFMYAHNWQQEGASFESKNLPISVSVHFPVSLDIHPSVAPSKGYFKIESMRFRDPCLDGKLEQWWFEFPRTRGTVSYLFIKKLQYIMERLMEWNKVSSINIFNEKERVRGELASLNEKIIKHDMFLKDFVQEKQLNKEHTELLAQEEAYRRHKARETWLSIRDLNTKNFHSSTKAKRILIKEMI